MVHRGSRPQKNKVNVKTLQKEANITCLRKDSTKREALVMKAERLPELRLFPTGIMWTKAATPLIDTQTYYLTIL